MFKQYDKCYSSRTRIGKWSKKLNPAAQDITLSHKKLLESYNLQELLGQKFQI